MKISVTVDMDDYQDYRSLVDPEGDAAGQSFYTAVPRFLDAFDRHGIRATFFMIGRDADSADRRRVVREIASRGHEVGNHSFSHPYNFRALSRAGKETEIARGEEAIADVLGERPVGFRTPSCDVDEETLEILGERGYLYDASTFPTPLMLAFMLYGKLFVRRDDYQLGRVGTMIAPTRPYEPRGDRFYRPRRDSDAGPPIVEIPLSVVPFLRVPFYATLLRMAGPAFFDWCVRAHGRRRPMLHMVFHLIDLVDLEGSSLGGALERSPGLGVPFAKRERFFGHAMTRLAELGEGVPLREIALAHRGAAAEARG